METGKAIYKLLKDSADVGAICADRIFPELAQQDADAPFIVYTVVDTTPSPTKNATSKLDTARVELFCLSEDYEEAMSLGIAVRSALDRQSGTINGVEVQSIDFDTSDIQFDPDQRIYVLEHTYDVRIQRTGTAVSVAQFPGNTFTVTEVDGSPSAAVNKLVFSNGTVSIDGTTATVQSGAVCYYALTSHFHNVVSSADVYAPFVGTDEAANFDSTHMFLAPFDGSLKEVHFMRIGTNMASGTVELNFERVSGVDISSVVEQETLSAPINNYTSYAVTYDNAPVTSGSLYLLRVRNGTSESLGHVVISMVFEVTGIA